jgi:uncharacterized membrane protein YkvA (DUF1232 family)
MADDLEQYGQWLEALGADVLGLCEELTAAGPEPVEARSLQVGVVNLVLASLDFLPDGVEELGYLSDAFVLRVACALAVREGAAGAVACRLAREADGVSSFLGADYAKLVTQVRLARHNPVRGRTVDAIAADQDVQRAFFGEVIQWAGVYRAPLWVREPRTLLKLRAFFKTRLA